MNAMHYIFASYVFLLICGVIWFYSRTVGQAKAKDKKGYEKEQRLFSLYQDIEDMLKGFELYVEEAKAEIESRLNQAPEPWAAVAQEAMIQGPIGDAEKAAVPDEPEKKRKTPAKPEGKAKEKPPKTPKEAPAPDDGEAPPQEAGGEEPAENAGEAAARPKKRTPRQPAKRNSRPAEEMVSEYAAKGMDQHEIAKELGISSREVALILEIKKMTAQENWR